MEQFVIALQTVYEMLSFQTTGNDIFKVSKHPLDDFSFPHHRAAQIGCKIIETRMILTFKRGSSKKILLNMRKQFMTILQPTLEKWQIINYKFMNL